MLDAFSADSLLVLPWVQGIESEDFEPAEGMFGPYDSRKSGRPYF